MDKYIFRFTLPGNTFIHRKNVFAKSLRSAKAEFKKVVTNVEELKAIYLDDEDSKNLLEPKEEISEEVLAE